MDARSDSGSRIEFGCDACGARFAVAAELAGRRATCRRCRASLVVPGAPASPADAGAPAAARLEGATPAGRSRWRARWAWALALGALAAAGWAAAQWGGVFTTHGPRHALERAADRYAEAIEPLMAGGDRAWGTAAERTARVLAELDQRHAVSGSEPIEAMIALFRRQERFLSAAERVDRRQKSIRADIERYRHLVWHPPAEPGRLFEHLERLGTLRRELRQGLQALSESSAGAGAMLAELIGAEAAAAEILAARGVALRRFFGENEQQLRAALDAIEPDTF